MRIGVSLTAAVTLGVLSLAAVACSSDTAAESGPGDDQAPTPAKTSPTKTSPTKTSPTEVPIVQVLAPIEDVVVNIAESFLPQYFLVVTSGLPNGCVRFDKYDLTRSGDTITITVTNLEPAGPMACAQVYGTVETNVPLGGDFEGGKTYTVQVNDMTETFVAQGGAEPEPSTGGAPDDIFVGLGEAVSLEINRAAVFGPDKLRIQFILVQVDSRCPTGQTCGQPGDAGILTGVSGPVPPTPMMLTLGVPILVSAGLEIELVGLEPYPGSGPEGQEAGPVYRATIRVSRPDAGGE